MMNGSIFAQPVDREYLLTTRHVAQFAADGFLLFEQLVPDRINRPAVAELHEGRIPRGRGYQPTTPMAEFVDDHLADAPAIQSVLRMPEVRGIIQSLVGCEPLYDHHAVHTVEGGKEKAQHWHADAIIDTRMHFDVQLFYYPHDTPREMGGTMFLPGSQFRRINESDIAVHQNFLNQKPIVCKAGTVVVGHHGIWHCAQPNLTGRTRYMLKVRMNPIVRQLKLWNTDDLADPDVISPLGTNHEWYGNEHRIEYVNRIRFWRFIVGDEGFDMNRWLTRLENMPETLATTVA